ncbi:MAG: alpha/beta hydrolase, partial [Pyrodictiaceae archaeon]
MPFIVEITGFRVYVARYTFGDLPGVFFLHGYSFTGDVWEQTNVFAMLREKRRLYIAPDMPYGKKTRTVPQTRDENKILGLMDEIMSRYLKDNGILVGASLGGYFALKYSINNIGKVKGLLLLAP